MATYAIRPTAPARPPLSTGLLAILVGVLATVIGIAMTLGGFAFGPAVACLGATTWVFASAIDGHRRTLARLSHVRLDDLAVPLPVFPTASAHPHRDVALLPVGLPAVVAMPKGGWGVLPADVAEAALTRVGFDGRWHTVAEPVRLLPPDMHISDIGRIPRDGSAVLVDCEWPTPHGVTGAAIRAEADESIRLART